MTELILHRASNGLLANPNQYVRCDARFSLGKRKTIRTILGSSAEQRRHTHTFIERPFKLISLVHDDASRAAVFTRLGARRFIIHIPDPGRATTINCPMHRSLVALALVGCSAQSIPRCCAPYLLTYLFIYLFRFISLYCLIASIFPRDESKILILPFRGGVCFFCVLLCTSKMEPSFYCLCVFHLGWVLPCAERWDEWDSQLIVD